MIQPRTIELISCARSSRDFPLRKFSRQRLIVRRIVFAAPSDGSGPLPEEPEHLALVLSGEVRRAPVEHDRPIDVYDAIDAVRAVFDALEIPDSTLAPVTTTGWRPGRAARVEIAGVDAGMVGEISAEVVDALRLTAPVVAAELRLDALFDAPRRDRVFRAPSRFPGSAIDLAFVVREDLPAAAIAATLRETAGDLLDDLRAFDVFRSDTLGQANKSITFRLRFRAPDRTLTDDEVGVLRQRGIDAVVVAHNAQLRT